MKVPAHNSARLITGILFSFILVFGQHAAAVVNENCGCHARIMEQKRFTHLPVLEGKCASCHKPSDKKHPRFKKEAFILADNGKSGLCNECHEHKDTMKFVHTPVANGDCLRCHDVHQSDNKSQLKIHADQLCFNCHKKELFNRAYPHVPIAKGKCTGCHDPHQSNVKFMLKAEGMKLCFLCHKKESFTGTSIHKPIADDNCSACHITHGTSYPNLLKLNNPETFYTPFIKSSYALCFSCHSNKIADEAKTETDTNFRNGLDNLHFIHVNKDEKGRTCKTCHDAHSAAQPKLISKKVPGFGKWRIPVRFLKTSTGGTCVVGCHKHKTYNRITPVTNP